MPKITYKIITPKGEFGSARKAAVAHECDHNTIVNRCVTDPLNYRRIARQPQPPKPPPVKRVWGTRKITWPLNWSEYRFLTHEEKEEIYHTWCAEQTLDPDQEHSANAFFDAMDATAEVADDATD